jgi:hypothetical protein
MIHLMRYVLQPILYALNALDHLGHLGTNNSLVVQIFAEGFALSGPPACRK